MAGRGSHPSTSSQQAASAASAAPPPKKEKGLQNDLVKMVYGYGDEKQPMQESIDLLDSLVKEYLEEMCRQVSFCVWKRKGTSADQGGSVCEMTPARGLLICLPAGKFCACPAGKAAVAARRLAWTPVEFFEWSVRAEQQ